MRILAVAFVLGPVSPADAHIGPDVLFDILSSDNRALAGFA